MAVPDDDNAISFYFRNSSTVSSLIELLILKTSLSKNQTSWEMKISTHFKFCPQLGTQGGCTEMPFIKVEALLLPW